MLGYMPCTKQEIPWFFRSSRTLNLKHQQMNRSVLHQLVYLLFRWLFTKLTLQLVLLYNILFSREFVMHQRKRKIMMFFEKYKCAWRKGGDQNLKCLFVTSWCHPEAPCHIVTSWSSSSWPTMHKTQPSHTRARPHNNIYYFPLA